MVEYLLLKFEFKYFEKIKLVDDFTTVNRDL